MTMRRNIGCGGILLVCAMLLACLSGPVFAEPMACKNEAGYVFPQKGWGRVDPAAAGWSVDELQVAKQYAKAIGSQSWLLVENGKIVDSYGPIERVNSLHSARKSFMSAMYGQAIADGTIDMSETLKDLGIDDNDPVLTPEEKQATIRELLMARSGVYHIAQGEAPSMAAARPKRFSHTHGTYWYYNNWDFNALGTIFNQLTKSSLFEFLHDRIAVPLNMEDFKLSDQQYLDGPESIHKYYNMEMSARDMARFGQLFLAEGCWQGKQIVPAEWVRESTAPYSDTKGDFQPLGLGYYGYLWWVGASDRFLPNTSLPNGSFAALGLGPQIILVIPSKRLVLIHRTGTDSICAFDRTDCSYNLIPNSKVFSLLQMIVQAKKPNPAK
jgi:CubicO group peptidase (beta-lactamase class C family)